MLALTILTLTTAAAASPPVGAALEDSVSVHLGIALRLRGQEDLDRLLADQQDPRSPMYRQWLSPEQFGARFGLAPDGYEKIASWLESYGFAVTRYPNRLFLEAVGTAARTRALLGVQLRWAEADGRRFRTFEGEVSLPADLGPDILAISGLDTRLRHHHHHHVRRPGGPSPRIDTTYQGQVSQALGPDDLRLEYDMAPLISGGNAAAGLTLAVLATQEGTTTGHSQNPGTPFIPPSTTAIQAYFTLANASVTYNPIVMQNPNDDFDIEGSNQEYQLDVEMQSVAAANAQDIDLVMAPTSEVFITGAQYIVNSLPNAVAVSTSLGTCESEESQYNGGGPTTAGSEPAVMRQTVQQGVAEGQTWFAAAGDTGADDCNDNTSGTRNGFNGGNATIDFPGSMPEFVCLGGTQFMGAGSWDSSGNLSAFEPETTWNEGQQGGAGGGGQSMFYAKPPWQAGVGPQASDGARDVPDLSLEASTGTPGTAVYDCGSGQDQSCSGETTGAGTLDVLGGTSFAGPLAAGITALLAGKLGCHLGDIHSALYALGQGAHSAAVFHDITSGNNSYADPSGTTITGFNAQLGYDLATGWGSLDVAQLVAAWPACGGTSGGTSGGGSGTPGTSGSSSSSTSTGRATSTGGSTGSSQTTIHTAGSSSGGGSESGGYLPPKVAPEPKATSGCSCGTNGRGDASTLSALLLLTLAGLRRRGGRTRR